MQLVVWAAMAGICGYLLLLLTRSDGDARRLRGLALNGEVLAEWRVVVAKSWVNRRVGLLNHASLDRRCALWLDGTGAVHVKGMLFPIDVLFLDAGGAVITTAPGVQPDAAPIVGPSGSVTVLEMAAGVAADLGLKVGDRLELRDVRTSV